MSLHLLTRYGLPRDSGDGGGAAEYTAYRILISANNGDASFVGTRELSLIETLGDDLGFAVDSDGTAFASSEGSSTNYPAARAFNGTRGGTNDGWLSQMTPSYPEHVGIILPTAKRLYRYALGKGPTGTNPNTRAPRDWKIQGSNDTTNGADGTWDDLDERSGVTNWNEIAATAALSFEVAPKPGEAIYRLLITETNDDEADFAGTVEFGLRATVGGESVAVTADGIPSSSGEQGVAPAAGAFDGSTASGWIGSGGVYANPGEWVQFRFDADPGVVQYTVGAYPGNAARSAKAWLVQKSVDGGVTFSTIDSVSGETGWSLLEERVFTL